MKKRLLFITQSQFGYLTDYVRYTDFLKSDYEIDFLCWDYGKTRIVPDGINVKYISRSGNLLSRNIRFIKEVKKFIKNSRYDIIYMHYFRGSSLLPLRKNNTIKYYIDVRTAGIMPSKIRRATYDFFLRLECSRYHRISVVSEGVKRRLKLPARTKIIPLGAEPQNFDRPISTGLNLLYVGTFANRSIEDSIAGVGLFMQKFPDANVHYRIIGDGDAESTQKILKTIEENNLSTIVEMPGYVPHAKLSRYYAESNVGVSYIPITDYYNFQPATKTFEYMLTGIPVIATATEANKFIVNESNGVITLDNPVSFCDALEKIRERLKTYDAQVIKKSVDQYQWKNIVLSLKDYLIQD